jgi:hypothetical protein
VQLEFSLKNDAIDSLFSPADSKYLRIFAEGRKSDMATGELLLRMELGWPTASI